MIRCERIQEWAGLYVVGGLTGIERSAFEQHLAVCDGCRAQVESLASALQSEADKIQPLVPSAQLKLTLMSHVAADLKQQPSPALGAKARGRQRSAHQILLAPLRLIVVSARGLFRR